QRLRLQLIRAGGSLHVVVVDLIDRRQIGERGPADGKRRVHGTPSSQFSPSKSRLVRNLPTRNERASSEAFGSDWKTGIAPASLNPSRRPLRPGPILPDSRQLGSFLP